MYSVCEEFPGGERDIIYFIYLTVFNLGELCAKTDRQREDKHSWGWVNKSVGDGSGSVGDEVI